MKCIDCDYENDLAAQVARHRRSAHDITKHALTRSKLQFFALIEATGTFINAVEAGDKLRIWANDQKPTAIDLKRWRDEYEDNRDQGVQSITDGHVDTMKRRLTAALEYKARKMTESYFDAGISLSRQAVDGELDAAKQVTLKYAADGAFVNYREVKDNSPKSSGAMINKLVINAGPPPQRRLKEGVKADVIIDAEVRELPVGDSG